MKHAIDDAVKNALLERPNCLESFSLIDGRLLVCGLAVGVALLALAWDYQYPFPQSKYVVFVKESEKNSMLTIFYNFQACFDCLRCLLFHSNGRFDVVHDIPGARHFRCGQSKGGRHQQVVASQFRNEEVSDDEMGFREKSY